MLGDAIASKKCLSNKSTLHSWGKNIPSKEEEKAMQNTHKTVAVGEEECDGLCPDIRVRGDLGNHQFRLIILTKMTKKLKL